MRVTIRAAHPQDAKAVSKIIRDELEIPVSASDTAQRLAKFSVNPRHQVFIALVDDLVIGFLHVCDYDSVLYHYHMKQVTAMAVARSYRRVGIGRALLSRAERWAAETGAVRLRLDAALLPEDTHAFFEACGYERGPEELRFEKVLAGNA